MAASGTTPHAATAGRSHLCHAISQALQRATGTTEEPLAAVEAKLYTRVGWSLLPAGLLARRPIVYISFLQ